MGVVPSRPSTRQEQSRPTGTMAVGNGTRRCGVYARFAPRASSLWVVGAFCGFIRLHILVGAQPKRSWYATAPMRAGAYHDLLAWPGASWAIAIPGYTEQLPGPHPLRWINQPPAACALAHSLRFARGSGWNGVVKRGGPNLMWRAGFSCGKRANASRHSARMPRDPRRPNLTTPQPGAFLPSGPR
jgi:hypothetical protein